MAQIIAKFGANDGHQLKIWENHEIHASYLANGPWKKSLNFIFPTKYVIPKSLKGWPLAK